MKKRLGNCQNWCRKGRIGLIIRAYTPRPRPSVVCFTHIFSPVHLLISLYQCSRCAAPGHRVGWKIAGRTLRRGSGPLCPKIVCGIQSKNLSISSISKCLNTEPSANRAYRLQREINVLQEEQLEMPREQSKMIQWQLEALRGHVNEGN
jgi:hypothetical protein